ncbi:MAG: PepSY domain-containing protein [Gammaproteobacteria bacterium]|nr:PepSY domain-containing protein [Gammaproteobacteria bacterium]
MYKQIVLPVVIAGSMFAGIAMAGPECTDQSQENWIPVADMQKKLLEDGFVIDRFKIDDTCYEIYGRNAKNEKVEIYFNPVNGEIVKQEIES